MFDSNLGSPPSTFWVNRKFLSTLYRAKRLCYVVGTHTDSYEYGNILRLASVIETVSSSYPDIVIAPVFDRRLNKYDQFFDSSLFIAPGAIIPIFHAEGAIPVNDEPCLTVDGELVEIPNAPVAYSQMVVYGNDFLHETSRLAQRMKVIESISQWTDEDDKLEHIPVLIILGQRFDAAGLGSVHRRAWVDLLDRASLIEVQDSVSREVVVRMCGDHIADKINVTAADASFWPILKQVGPVIEQSPSQDFIIHLDPSLLGTVFDRREDLLNAISLALTDVPKSDQGVTCFVPSVVPGFSPLEQGLMDDIWPLLPEGSSVSRLELVQEILDQFRTFRLAHLTLAASYEVALTSLSLSLPTILFKGSNSRDFDYERLRHEFLVPDELYCDLSSMTVEQVANKIRSAIEDNEIRHSGRLAALTGIVNALTAKLAPPVPWRYSAGVGYVEDLEKKYKDTVHQLYHTMERLSDLQSEYERLLNVRRVPQRRPVQESSTANPSPTYTSQIEAYQVLVGKVRERLAGLVPPEATVLVVSKGDAGLVDLPGRIGWHFPQTEDGTYAGYHPADSAAAITHLEELRAKGAAYLLIPATAFWWLEYYTDFAAHLERHYHRAWADDHCLVYAFNAVARERLLRSPRLFRTVLRGLSLPRSRRTPGAPVHDQG